MGVGVDEVDRRPGVLDHEGPLLLGVDRSRLGRGGRCTVAGRVTVGKAEHGEQVKKTPHGGYSVAKIQYLS